jgi:hypothetical protein
MIFQMLIAENKPNFNPPESHMEWFASIMQTRRSRKSPHIAASRSTSTITDT